MTSTHSHRPCGRILIALITLVLAAHGCASGPSLVGRWKAMEGSASVEFAVDGGFHAVDNEGMPVSGKYRLVGADGIQFEIRHGEADAEVVDARYTRLGERLTLAFPGEGAIETYHRIP
ncbi:hypothetical protein DSCA_16320 [Desulfosarcina alkanivorans]|jgi:hypothetical protein|uniref:DUF5640 domain-containing protein n=1 Tax=Desulfosarcina alkanivorans TaxID=571177 RepID=A0A5K7YDW7_9BACT|nr:hypothetical protein [Desulfosarcina alkanivorans]BBO67702.1 hypothetical protein DSCA_16320 [Desulfosarcina alkanivorans]